MVTGIVLGEGFFLSVMACVFLLIFNYCMRSFDRKMRLRFTYVVLALLVAIGAEVVDSNLAQLASPVLARYIVLLVKVSMEGFAELEVVYIMLPKATMEHKYLLSIPFLVCLLVNLTAPFGQHVIYFTPDNKLAFGPLACLIYIEMAIYFLVLLHIAFSKVKEGNWNYCIVITLAVAINIFAAVVEFLGICGKPVLGVAAITVAFIHMYLYAERYNFDSITHCLKRRCFYSDCAKHSKNKMSIVSMDLNDLKYLNDNFGHAAGDEALRTLAEVTKSLIIGKPFQLYRTGGDEFMILGNKVDSQTTIQLVDDIRQKLGETPYTCSFGVAMYEPGKSLDEIVKRADKAMYSDKEHYKMIRKQQLKGASLAIANQ